MNNITAAVYFEQYWLVSGMKSKAEVISYLADNYFNASDAKGDLEATMQAAIVMSDYKTVALIANTLKRIL